MNALPRLALNLLDGRSASVQPVMLQISERSAQILRRKNDDLPGEMLLEIPLDQLHKQLRWPEATQRGARIIELTDRAPAPWEGAQLHGLLDQDPQVFDAWVAQHISRQANPSASLIVRAQQSWRGAALAFVVLLAVIGGMVVYGLPVAARSITALVPQSADQAIGRNALQQIDGRWMQPSKLPLEDQKRIRERFLAGVKAQYPKDTPSIALEFRKSEIGPNAFALPGGIMVMTDELVQLVKDDAVHACVLQWLDGRKRVADVTDDGNATLPELADCRDRWSDDRRIPSLLRAATAGDEELLDPIDEVGRWRHTAAQPRDDEPDAHGERGRVGWRWPSAGRCGPG